MSEPAADVCYRCKQSGHMAKDCPTKKGKLGAASAPAIYSPALPVNATPASAPVSNSADICYRCKQPGHLASKCPTKKRPRDESESAAPVSLTAAAANPVAGAPPCYRCQQVGHMAKDCPLKRAKAGITHHPSRPVPAAAEAPSTDSSRVCYKCKLPGHLSRDCANETAASTRGVRPEAAAARSRPPPRTSTLRCFRCQSTEHSTIDCALPKPCHYCQSHDHLAATCPEKRAILRERNEAQAGARPCNRCGEVGHIARLCPKLEGKRVIYRDESKPRSLTCYICDAISHHAVECPRIEELKRRVTRLCETDDGSTSEDLDLDGLLSLCARAMDYSAAVLVYQRMLLSGATPTERTWTSLDLLHDRSGHSHRHIDHQRVKEIKKPRAFIKEIVTARRINVKQQQSQPLVSAAHALLTKKPDLLTECKNRFDLCKILVAQIKVSAKQSREIVSALAKGGHLAKTKAGLAFNPEVADLATGQAETTDKRKNRKKNKKKNTSKSQKCKKVTSASKSDAAKSEAMDESE